MPEPPPSALVHQVNTWLHQHGYRPTIDEARRVAAACPEDRLPDADTLHRLAATHHLARQGQDPAVPEPTPLAIPEEAVQTAADEAWVALQEPLPLLDPFLSKLVDAAVEGPWFRAVRDITPRDVSSHAEPTDVPADLAAFATVGEALNGLLTGNTVATYVSGSGRAAETWAEAAFQALAAVVADTAAATIAALYDAWRARCGWPDETDTAEAIRAAWLDAVLEALADQGHDDIWLREYVDRLSWEETLRRLRPDAVPRFLADRERRQKAVARQEAWRTWAASWPAWPVDTDPVDGAVAVTLAAIRDGADALALSDSLTDPAFAPSLPRQAQRAWRRRCRAWLRAVAPADLDTPGALVSLWRWCTAQWLADGRSWYWTAVDRTDAVHTFARDNWEWALAWAAGAPEWTGALILRRFEPLADPDNRLPIKTVCGLRFHQGTPVFLDAATVRVAARTHPDTGARLEPEPAVRYADAERVLTGWQP